MSSRHLSTYSKLKTARPKQLGQVKIASSNTAELIYTLPNKGTHAIITSWSLVNSDNKDRTIKIYHDASGTTWDTTTIIYSDKMSNATGTLTGDLNIAIADFDGSIAVEADDVDLTITIWGIESNIS